MDQAEISSLSIHERFPSAILRKCERSRASSALNVGFSPNRPISVLLPKALATPMPAGESVRRPSIRDEMQLGDSDAEQPGQDNHIFFLSAGFCCWRCTRQPTHDACHGSVNDVQAGAHWSI